MDSRILKYTVKAKENTLAGQLQPQTASLQPLMEDVQNSTCWVWVQENVSLSPVQSKAFWEGQEMPRSLPWHVRGQAPLCLSGEVISLTCLKFYSMSKAHHWPWLVHFSMTSCHCSGVCLLMILWLIVTHRASVANKDFFFFFFFGWVQEGLAVVSCDFIVYHHVWKLLPPFRRLGQSWRQQGRCVK